MPGPGPGPAFFFASSSKKINQPSNGGGPFPFLDRIYYFGKFYVKFGSKMGDFRRILTHFGPF